MSCNTDHNGTTITGFEVFQSLSGFLMSCNKYHSILLRKSVNLFQSLSGFLMSCNGIAPVLVVALIRVSIPIGFSNEL